MKAAAKAEGLLQEAGFTTHTDTANQYTPGQKMKYWWVELEAGGQGRGWGVSAGVCSWGDGGQGGVCRDWDFKVQLSSVISNFNLIDARRETAGVRVRVEIGPRDAAQGTVVVALAGSPGTVAQKTTVNLTVQMVREVKKLLAEVGGVFGVCAVCTQGWCRCTVRKCKRAVLPRGCGGWAWY